MQNLPSLRQLQYLIAVADTGSFSEAANICHVTQSTLSAGIAALEGLAGHRLIDRSGRTSTLTASGADMLERARGIVAEAGDMMARLHTLSAPLSGPLRLGIIPTVAPYLLPRILPALQTGFPQLELQIKEDLSDRLVEALRAGQLDVLLMAFPFVTEGMAQEPLFTEDFVIAAPAGKWKGPNPANMNDLNIDGLLLLEEGHCLRDHALAACKLQPRRQRQAFNASSLPTLIQMVGHGYGFTLLPEMGAQKENLPETIEIVPFAAPAPRREIGLVWRKNNARARDYRMLADHIKECWRGALT